MAASSSGECSSSAAPLFGRRRPPRRAIDLLVRERRQVLVSDIGMPGGDGYQLIARVRNELRLSSEELPAVALTAFARPEDAMCALSAGYNSHLAKPVDVGELLTTVAQPRGLWRRLGKDARFAVA